MKKTIVLMGRLDSKGKEYAYVKEKILAGGFDVITVDTGTRGSPIFKPDISREEVAQAAGVDAPNVSSHITMNTCASRVWKFGDCHS